MIITAFELAARFIGVSEVAGTASNPLVLAMLRLDNKWPTGDDVAWCGAFVNFITWMLRLPRSKKLSARSWLGVGEVVQLEQAKVGFDVVILKRGEADQPGPEVLDAPGHVGFFAGLSPGKVNLLGGNQGNVVSVSPFHVERILGIRRLSGVGN